MPDIDVARTASLARLELSAEETTRFHGQLRQILEYVAQLGEVDVSGIEPTAHAVPVFDVMREDVSRPGFTADEALANAPRRVGDQFHVPKVLD